MGCVGARPVESGAAMLYFVVSNPVNSSNGQAKPHASHSRFAAECD